MINVVPASPTYILAFGKVGNSPGGGRNCGPQQKLTLAGIAILNRMGDAWPTLGFAEEQELFEALDTIRKSRGSRRIIGVGSTTETTIADGLEDPISVNTEPYCRAVQDRQTRRALEPMSCFLCGGRFSFA